MARELTLGERCTAVGRLLRVQPTSHWIDAFCELFPDAGEQDVQAIEQDYLRLFVGLGTPLAPPWESVWANDARLIFQRQTLDVRYWYRSAGLQVEQLHREPDDHIGYELEFVGLLLERGEAQTAAAFACEHPLCWAERWQQAVQDAARSGVYPRLAREALDLLRTVAG